MLWRSTGRAEKCATVVNELQPDAEAVACVAVASDYIDLMDKHAYIGIK